MPPDPPLTDHLERVLHAAGDDEERHYSENGHDPYAEIPHPVETADQRTDLSPFPMVRIGDMARAADAAPRPQFIVRGLFVESDYGVLGAERKFGKTFLVTDLAVTVAAGGNFLGAFPIDRAGPVALFAGEGGRRKIVRRARAVAAFHGVDLDDLPLYVYERAPKLAEASQIERLRITLTQIGPVLCIIDPAYLSLSGAKTADLTSMGALLERPQLICQDVGAGLLLSVHWNKSGLGTGVDRFTGAGMAEWGRLLVSGRKVSDHVDSITKTSSAICKLEIIGDEIAGTEITYRRRVWVDDPNDLTSAMHYVIELVEESDEGEPDEETSDLKPAARRVLAVLRSVAGAWMNCREIGDKLAALGRPLKARTIYEACQALVSSNLADEATAAGNDRKRWCALTTTPNGAGNVP